MKTYIAMAHTSVSNGRVKLTEQQAKSRLHNLKTLGHGIYEVVNPIQLKRGEVFGADGDLPKGHAEERIEADAKTELGSPKSKKTKSEE